MSYTLKLRRDPSFRWMQVNPVLAEGEPGFETDTYRFKIGDGVTPWKDLEYFVSGDSSPIPMNLQEHIDSPTPHPVYDDGPSLALLYENAKV